MPTDQTAKEDRITGHIIRLDDTRLVFLGESPDLPDTWFVGLRNAEGNDTKLVLSREALAALVKLASEPFKGPRAKFPHKMIWRVVEEGALEKVNNDE